MAGEKEERKKRGRKSIGFEDLPKAVRLTLVKIMNDRKLDDVEEGLIVMASIALPISRAINEDAIDIAEGLYRKRHFAEQNKTVATIQKKTKERIQTAWNEGWAASYKKYAITYPCSVCGQLLYVEPNSEVHRVIIDHLRTKGWGHTTCVSG